MRAATALLFVAAALAGCGGGDDRPAQAIELEGLVVAIAYESGKVDSFTLRTADGDTHELAIADDVDYGFDLAHLEEHRVRRLPVRCTAEERGERLVALEILDA